MTLIQHHAILAFFSGLPGWAEMLVIAFVGLLVFGKRLPDVARSLGQSIVEFKKGMSGVKDEIETAAKTPVNTQPHTPQALPPSNAETAQATHAPKQSVESAD